MTTPPLALRIYLLTTALVCAGLGCDSTRSTAAPPRPATQTSDASTPTPASDTSLPAAPSTPKGAQAAEPLPDVQFVEILTGTAEPTDELPMIVMIHGLGGRPEDLKGIFVPAFQMPARIILPQGLESYGGGFSWFPISRPIEAASPEMVDGLARSADAIAALIERLSQQRRTRGKAIVSGFSQGGMLSFTIALRHPKVARLAIPVSGWLPPALMPEGQDRIEGLPPIRALHGDLDPLVKFEPTRVAVEALVARGADAQLIPFEGVGHAFTRTMQVEYFNLLRESLTDQDLSEPQ